MKRRILLFVAICSLCIVPSTQAINPVVVDPNYLPLQNLPVLISAISLVKDPVFIELYNQSDSAVNLSGWKLELGLVASGAGSDGVQEKHIINLDRWLLSDSYLAVGNSARLGDSDVGFSLPTSPVDLRNHRLRSASLLSSSGTAHSITGLDTATSSSNTWAQRRSGSSGWKDNFISDYTFKTDTTLSVRGHGWYQPPLSSPQARVVEIYPNASDCAPNDTSILCGDYVKLYNPSDQTIDLSDYRVRTDSGVSLGGNAFHLDTYQPIPSRQYLNISLRDDGDLLSLTDDGGYVWLEDSEGAIRYDETIVQYPSASSTTKIGWSWAQNLDGVWEWTSAPQPLGANVFPVSTPPTSKIVEIGVCPIGKYRNPDTNRCRTIEEAVNALAACDEGEYRNPETNRCKKTAILAGATLSACDDDQERNPLTNRCRKVAGASTGVTTPCKKGYERNPETNRCRKVTSGAAAASITSTEDKSNPMTLWFGIALITIAAGYGIYEWRGDIWRFLKRFIPVPN